MVVGYHRVYPAAWGRSKDRRLTKIICRVIQTLIRPVGRRLGAGAAHPAKGKCEALAGKGNLDE